MQLAQISPGIGELRTYDRAWLRGDVIAGLTVAAYMLPQAMAYAGLAGMPSAMGLWLAVIALVVYFLIGKSRVLSAGPDSTVALLTAAALAPLAAGDPTRYAMLAALLAGMVGVISLIAWVARMGFAGDFISRPVLVGYMGGTGVIMVVSQLGKVTGLDLPGDTFFEQVTSFLASLDDGVNLPSVVLGASVAAGLIVLTPRFPTLPMPLIIVGTAAAVTALFHLHDLGVETVGQLHLSLPHLSAGLPSMKDVTTLALPAFGIFVVGFSNNILAVRMLATRRHEKADGNRELLALGAVNIASAAASGFPMSSSSSRAVLADTAGAKTQVYSLVAAATTVVVIVVFPGVLEAFPEAALGGLIIYAAVSLIEVREYQRLWHFRRREFFLAMSAAVGVLAFNILYGVLAAVALSIVELLVRVTRPRAAILGQVPGMPGWHDISDYPTAGRIDGLVVFRYDSPLFFANAENFAERCEEALDESPTRPQWLLINMESNTVVDITALDALEHVRRVCVDRGVVLALVRVTQAVTVQLNRHGVGERIGRGFVFPTLPTAVAAYEEWVEPS